ncbi:MAG: tetratricopeptide repeat protein [Treponema sp.]|nr:tetratricopeptide repeat protein [Treponema sp.]
MNTSDSLNSVYFINLPESFTLSEHALPIDPSIPLPVQKKDGDAPGSFNMEELTQEQILAGILTILAYDSKNEHVPYYRSILKAARPNIKKEMTEAGILKAKNEDFDLAEEIFKALRGFDPDDMGTVLNMALLCDQRADSYRSSGLIEDADAYDNDALSYYKDAMNAEPEIPDAFFNAGFYHLKKHNYGEAKSCFESYLALTVDVKDEELGENGIYKKKRAAEVLEDIKNRNMDDDHFIAAHQLIANGEEEKGLEEIRLFLQKNAGVWNAWFMLGWALRKLGRFADARQAFEKALTCEGGDKNADTYNELSICCMEEKELAKAREYLLKALSIAPESTKIISNLGYVSMKEGKPAEAAAYFQTALEIDPNDTIAKAALESLDR